MKFNFNKNRSSVISSGLMIAVNFVAGTLLAFFRVSLLSGGFFLLFLLGLCARAWAGAAGKNLSVNVSCPKCGLFPGDSTELRLEIKNAKLLPLPWADIYLPLPKNLCLTPAVTRLAEEREIALLRSAGANESQVGVFPLPPMGGHSDNCEVLPLKANRRGIYHSNSWLLSTGDGLGLAQTDMPLALECQAALAVYPALQKVKAELFLRNLWNADTGRRGVSEDVTVIRSTREYLPSDSARSINWREVALGLPLSVNVYEKILPRSAHFLLDGESFCSGGAESEALEDCISILASLLVRLEEQGVRCGLSLCRGSENSPVNLFDGDKEAMLRLLAGYNPLPPVLNSETGKPLPVKAEFFYEEIVQAASKTGRFYYLCFDDAAFTDCPLLQMLEPSLLSALVWKDSENRTENEVFSLPGLKEKQA